MRATIYDDPHLLKSTFPDVIFSAGRDQLDISLQSRQQASAEDNTRKSNKDGDAGSDLVTTESCQLSETNASPTKCLEPSNTLPRRSARLAQMSCQTKPVRKGILPSDPASKQDGGPLDRILAFMTLGTRNRTSLYNSRNEWKGWPKTPKAGMESEVAKYLNNIVNRARVFFNNGAQAPEGGDDLVFSARSVEKGGEKRKSHIVLVPRRRAKESDGWRHVHAVGELKPDAIYMYDEEDDEEELVDEIAERTGLCFGHQRERRFVLAFSLLDTKMALWKYDRSGAIASQEFDIHENPIDFLRIILGLALGPNYYVGYDPSFAYKDQRRIVELNGKDYEVMSVTLSNSANLGRGTVVHRVRDEEGQEFAMKDQWVDLSGTTNEISILEKLEEMNVQKVPRLVDYQIVRFKVGDEIVLDSTANDRANYSETWLGDKGITIRVHYRLLVTPYGDEVWSFRSLKELVSAFRDFVEGIRDIREKEIVHCDISLGNLILAEEGKSSHRRGYLIDFDCAMYTGGPATEPVGTLPFMATEFLLKFKVRHEYYHDLESLFYVLVWICLTHEAPGVQRRDFEFKKSPLQEWTGAGKYWHTNTRGGFKKSILDELPDYFRQSAVMTEFLEKLRSIVFRQTPDRWESDDARVILDREKSMKDRDMHDVFTEIFGVFDEALNKLANEPSPDSEIEAMPASDGKITA